ncbi:hypothetical protein D9M68_724330 [compost metagenome]
MSRVRRYTYAGNRCLYFLQFLFVECTTGGTVKQAIGRYIRNREEWLFFSGDDIMFHHSIACRIYVIEKISRHTVVIAA